jgi:hypothetical protein
LPARWIAGLLLLLGTTAAAQEFKAPQLSYFSADWDGALTALDGNEAVRLLPTPPIPSPTASNAKVELIARLNAATGKYLPDIAASPVPVLLPVKLDALGDGGGAAGLSTDFGAPKMFFAGPAGYDASFTVTLPPAANQPKTAADRDLDIDISGFAFVYDVGEGKSGEEKSPAGLKADFPDLRRLYFEGRMRYLFERYGVLYAVSVECFDGSNPKRLSCRDVHPIVVSFLKALTIAGGMPQPSAGVSGPVPRRADGLSTGFAYHSVGQLIHDTGSRNHGGKSDNTIFSNIRFPLAQAPAQTYSQLFMDLGDCTTTAGDSQKVKRPGAFRCAKVEAIVDLPAGGHYNYPWRDNFCETRGYSVGQCPFGIGHQGEDIVPVDCRMLSGRAAAECDHREHAIVAVHDGMVLRSPGQDALKIFVDGDGEHLLFRYLHMNPTTTDANGFVSGRMVHAGETVGNVSNYLGGHPVTSYHLHFDMLAPTKDGWAFVNPYMTLVLAYERLIGGRGTQIPDEVRGSAVATAKTGAPAAPQTAPSPGKQKSRSPR